LTTLLLDDHLLLRVLLDDEPASLRPDGDALAAAVRIIGTSADF
jgi:hypothetical protein